MIKAQNPPVVNPYLLLTPGPLTTSPAHVVRAFAQALVELQQEGRVNRCQRYILNQRLRVARMRQIGFRTLLPDSCQAPIITSFHIPTDPGYSFSPEYSNPPAPLTSYS